jgi:hypothetical protein
MIDMINAKKHTLNTPIPIINCGIGSPFFLALSSSQIRPHAPNHATRAKTGKFITYLVD